MQASRRDFLKGLMATTAVAALPVPVAAAEAAVYSGVDWAAGPSITAVHIARGHAFFWISSDGALHELYEELMAYKPPDGDAAVAYLGEIGVYEGIRFVESAAQTCEQTVSQEPAVSQGSCDG